MRKILLLPLLALILILAAGCNTPPVELAGIKRVAVLTFDDSAWRQPMLGRGIKYELLAGMPRHFALEVIDGAAIEADLPGASLDAVLSRPEALVELGRRYGVDGFVTGTVTSYEEQRDGQLGLIQYWNEQDRAHVGVRVTLGVRLSFNARLIRVGDGAPLIYRQTTGLASRSFTLDPKRPFQTVASLLEPHFAELKDQAVRQAVHNLIWDIAREYAPKS